MTTTLSADQMARIRRNIDLVRAHTDDTVLSDYLYQTLKILAAAEETTASALVGAGLAARDRRDAATVAVAAGKG